MRFRGVEMGGLKLRIAVFSWFSEVRALPRAGCVVAPLSNSSPADRASRRSRLNPLSSTAANGSPAQEMRRSRRFRPLLFDFCRRFSFAANRAQPRHWSLTVRTRRHCRPVPVGALELCVRRRAPRGLREVRLCGRVRRLEVRDASDSSSCSERERIALQRQSGMVPFKPVERVGQGFELPSASRCEILAVLDFGQRLVDRAQDVVELAADHLISRNATRRRPAAPQVSLRDDQSKCARPSANLASLRRCGLDRPSPPLPAFRAGSVSIRDKAGARWDGIGRPCEAVGGRRPFPNSSPRLNSSTAFPRPIDDVALSRSITTITRAISHDARSMREINGRAVKSCPRMPAQRSSASRKPVKNM